MRSTDGNSRRPEKRPAVVCDFDDTTVLENVAEMLLTEFGGREWREYRRQHSMYLISLKEYQELAFSTVKVGRETMKAMVKERATLRPHFKTLFEYCRKKNIPLAIASMGLDFYVEALLEREGMESLPYFTVDTEFTPEGINFGYRFTWEGCWQRGNCKCRVLEQYRCQGHTILYAGDGRSDVCPATKSDTVFAHRYLAQHFRENSLPYVGLTDFSTVLDTVKDLSSPPYGEGPR